MENSTLFASSTFKMLPGYPIGYKENGCIITDIIIIEYYINNHVSFEVEVFKVDVNKSRVVGF